MSLRVHWLQRLPQLIALQLLLLGSQLSSTTLHLRNHRCALALLQQYRTDVNLGRGQSQGHLEEIAFTGVIHSSHIIPRAHNVLLTGKADGRLSHLMPSSLAFLALPWCLDTLYHLDAVYVCSRRFASCAGLLVCSIYLRVLRHAARTSYVY